MTVNTNRTVRAPTPDIPAWKWAENYDIDGQRYRGFRVDSVIPGFRAFHFLHGLPARYLDPLLIAAQESPTPYFWRVDRRRLPEEVDPATLAKARWLFDQDASSYRNAFMTFLVELPDGTRDLLGCAAARHQISPAYLSQGWIVIGRLLVRPEYRGQGLARLLNFTFFASSQHISTPPALGCFIGTESEQTRKLCTKAVANGSLDMFKTSRKRWRLIDQVFEVEAFGAFYPGVKPWLLATVEEGRSQLRGQSAAVDELLDAADGAWRSGYDDAGGVRIGRLFAACEEELVALALERPAMALYYDFLAAARAMGTFEG